VNINDLQSRLDGTYDLSDPVDCKAVIKMLLRDLDIANARSQKSLADLRSLSFMINVGNPKASEKAVSVLSGSDKRTGDNVVDVLLRMSGEMSRAEELTDKDLTDEVLREVWGNLDFDGRPSAVLEEMIQRFKKYTGQPVTDEG
jgi:hypothetical protein